MTLDARFIGAFVKAYALQCACGFTGDTTGSHPPAMSAIRLEKDNVRRRCWVVGGTSASGRRVRVRYPPHPDLRQRRFQGPLRVNCGASSSAFADGEPVCERQTLWCSRSKTSANLSVVRLSGRCCVLSFARDDLPVGIQGDWELWRDPPSLMAPASRIDPRASPSRQRLASECGTRDCRRNRYKWHLWGRMLQRTPPPRAERSLRRLR